MSDTTRYTQARSERVRQGMRWRVISALVMMATAIGAITAGGWVFSLLVTFLGLIMVWEWGRMVRGLFIDDAMVAHAAVFALACFCMTIGWPILAWSLIVLGAAVVVAMADGRRLVLSAAGVLLIGAAGVSLILLRGSPEVGLLAVMLVMFCVWATDTFAMLTGKAIGGPLLFPSISPNKTWAGAIGGLLAAALTGAIFIHFVAGGSWTHGFIVGSALSSAAQAGDLFESGVKRMCRVKNTSELIPGHGGVLDRMDGLIGAAIAAVVIGVSMGGDRPFRVLLLGE